MYYRENSLGFRRKFKSKASAEFLENEVFAAAKDKIEYVSLLSRLFHECNCYKKKKNIL